MFDILKEDKAAFRSRRRHARLCGLSAMQALKVFLSPVLLLVLAYGTCPTARATRASKCKASQGLSAAEYVAAGAEFFELQDFASAADCFQFASDHPDSALPQVGAISNTNLATALEKLGRDGEALKALARAVDADGSDAEALLMYGKALHKDGQITKARQWLEKCLQINANDFKAVYALGTVFQQEGKFDEALKMYEKCSSLNKSYLPAQIQEAIVLSLLKECTRAMPKALHLTETHPDMDTHMQSALATVFSGCDDQQMLLHSYLSSILKSPGKIVQVGADRRTNELRAAAVLLQLHKPELAISYLLKAEAAGDPDPARVQVFTLYDPSRPPIQPLLSLP